MKLEFWLKVLGLTGVLVAVHLAEPTTAAAIMGAEVSASAAIFCLGLLSSSAGRHVLLRLLMSTDDASADDTAVDEIILRLALVFFPSTKHGEAMLDRLGFIYKIVQRNHRRSETDEEIKMRARTESVARPRMPTHSPRLSMTPPRLSRISTNGAGVIPESLTTDELPAFPSAPPLPQPGRRLRSVLFVSREDTARIALPPTAAVLVLALNVAIAGAAAALSLLSIAPELQPHAQKVLRVGLLLRCMVPVDFAVGTLVADAIVINDVSPEIQPGLWYFSVLVRLVAWCLAATYVLATLGVEVGGVLTAWGLLGFGATLSLQQVAKDLFSTFQLFMTRPFDVGDVIEAGHGHLGRVVQVNLRFTTLQIIEGNQLLAIPNTQLADTRIQNFTRIKSRRGEIRLRVAHSTEIGKLRAVPGWMEAAVTAAKLAVVFSRLEEADEKGMLFVCAFEGPSDHIAFMQLRQEALLLTLESFRQRGVQLTQGTPAMPVSLVASAGAPGTTVDKSPA